MREKKERKEMRGTNWGGNKRKERKGNEEGDVLDKK